MPLVEPLVEPLAEPAGDAAAVFLHFASWAVWVLVSFLALTRVLAAFDPISLSRHVFTGGSTGTAEAAPTHETAAKNPATNPLTTIALKR